MTSPEVAPALLPSITIQPSFLTVLSEVQSGLIPSEKIWISAYKPDAESIGGSADDLRLDLDEASGYQSGSFVASSSSSKMVIGRTRVLPPVQEYTDPSHATQDTQAPKRITALAVAEDSSQFATGFLDGTVHLFPSESEAASTSLDFRQRITPWPILDHSKRKAISRAHKSTVTALRYFPSSQVLLSASSDFSLVILPANPLDVFDHPTGRTIKVEPARTLIGHTRPVTSLGMIGKGRLIVSGSSDTKLKLWEVSECQMFHATEDELNPQLIYSALQNGTWSANDLRVSMSDQSQVSSTISGSLSSIATSEDGTLLATGSSKGLVSLFDLRSPSNPLLVCTITTSDGLPYVSRISGQDPTVVDVDAELVGMDCDPIRHVKVVHGNGESVFGKHVWTAGDDGLARRYFV
ncbi:WD40-repeat-containing domain protein [Flagelloscypha sp. PMI_526]|nr:WD40-repeat-containing domain protein [Flagelloscypha sp. PMI_526]